MSDLVIKVAPVVKIYKNDKVPLLTRIIGTTLIILSGTLLVLDKIFDILDIESSHTFGYSNFSNFIWAFTQSVAPILMIIGFYMKPYKISFIVPVYCYCLQLIWVFGISHSDQNMQYLYAFGISLLYVVLVFVLKLIIFTAKQKEKENEEFIQDAKDVMDILKSKVLEANI